MAGSISPDGARSEITENALKAGNPVKTSAGAKATASQPVYVDSSSNMATGAFPFTLPVDIDSNTASVASFDVVGLEGVITGTVVNIAGSTVTQTGALRITVTDATGIGATTGAYYIPFGTLA